jgi:glucokinase
MVAKRFAVGIDIGGTKIAAGLLDDSGNVIARHSSRGHTGQAPEAVLEAAAQVFQEVLQKAGVRPAEIVGVGVGFAGHTHGEAGLVLTSSNLPAWDRHPLRDRLARRLGVPVVLDNDAHCSAWGEYRYGAGRGSRLLSYVTFSTGLGMGVIIDGHLLSGATGTAGEIGHTVVDVNGPLCTCGKRGCVMSYACGLAISRMACERVAGNAPTVLREMCGSEPEHISGEVVAEAARRGDDAARAILETAGYYLGVGLSTIVQVLNPDRIVLGGGLMNASDLLMEPCLRGLNENIHPVLRGSAQIVPSALGEDSGTVGAADLARAAAARENRA